MAKDKTRPTTPTGLAAEIVSATIVDLTWNASTDPASPGQTTSGVKGYRLFRDGAKIAELGPVLTYSDTGRVPSRTYKYSVAAVDNRNNQSVVSPQISVTMVPPAVDGPDTTAPSVPTGLNATAQGQTQINLTWSVSTDPTVAGQVTSGVIGYKVYRDSAHVATVALVPSYQDTGLVASTQYSYRVSAVDQAGNESAQSGAVLESTSGVPDQPDTTAPTVPANLSATAVSSSQINLTWSASTDPTVSGDTTSGVAGYQVYRGGSLIATLGLVTTYQDTGLAAATLYSYTVASRDVAGNASAQSGADTATTQAAPVGNFKCVRQGATGSASGADWTNAYTTLPTVLTRGTTYYLADGSYGGYTFDDAVSGTQLITLKKATTADHGSDSGWQAGYGDGQAVFGQCNFYTDYYTIDGQRRDAQWWLGDVSEYGIRFQGTGGKTLRLDNGSGTGGDHLTFRYVDAVGAGRDTGHGDDVVYGLAGSQYITFQYCAIRDSDRTCILTRGHWQNFTIEYCYLARNTSTAAIHGETMSSTQITNLVFRYNVVEDAEGTGVLVNHNNGFAVNWYVYGNVIFHSAAYHADTGRPSGHTQGIANGFVTVNNDASNQNSGTNVLVYNNSIINIKGLWSGVFIQAGSGNEVRNCLWHDCCRTNNSFHGTISHCWYYDTVQDGDSTPTKFVATAGQSDIFVNASGQNFRLKVATVAGQTLGSPYNVDMDGVTRGADGTWDRGAYEYAP